MPHKYFQNLNFNVRYFRKPFMHSLKKIQMISPRLKTSWALSENTIRELAGSAKNFP
jgi:hypothetical protein